MNSLLKPKLQKKLKKGIYFQLQRCYMTLVKALAKDTLTEVQ